MAIDMSLKQAMTLAALVLEFEAESSQANEWRAEVQQARQVISKAIQRPPVGEFFLSCPNRQRPGRKSNKVQV